MIVLGLELSCLGETECLHLDANTSNLSGCAILNVYLDSFCGTVAADWVLSPSDRYLSDCPIRNYSYICCQLGI